MGTLKVGQLVRFSEVKDAGDAEYIGKVLEIRGDRVLLEDQGGAFHIRPTRVVLIADVVPD